MSAPSRRQHRVTRADRVHRGRLPLILSDEVWPSSGVGRGMNENHPDGRLSKGVQFCFMGGVATQRHQPKETSWNTPPTIRQTAVGTVLGPSAKWKAEVTILTSGESHQAGTSGNLDETLSLLRQAPPGWPRCRVMQLHRQLDREAASPGPPGPERSHQRASRRSTQERLDGSLAASP